jgi:hypothetical protein
MIAVAPVRAGGVNSWQLAPVTTARALRWLLDRVRQSQSGEVSVLGRSLMERTRCVAPILALALVATCVHRSNLTAQANRDPLRSAMAKRIDEDKQGTGAVVGLLTPRDNRLQLTAG